MVHKLEPGLWHELEQEPATYGTLAARRIPEANVVIAVDHEHRHHVLLPIESETEGFTDARSRGLTVAPRVLEVEGLPGRPFLDLCCTDRSANDAFNVVVATLFEELDRDVKTVNAVRLTFARWRRFWGLIPIHGLTPEEVRGLFGELWFLLVWLLPHGANAVEHWVGPAGARNDFQWPGSAIEAKTTTSVRGHLHRINGLDQLDPPDGGGLSLFSLRLREEPAAANSLPVLIERISELLADAPEHLDLLEGRLISTGYAQAHMDRYQEMRFRIVDERLYRVEAEFPRLSATSFQTGPPAGIERIEYDINLEAFPQLISASTPDDFTPPPR